MHPQAISVASWNVHKAMGTDWRRDAHRVGAVIAEMAPQVMALQETDIRLLGARNVLDEGALGACGLRRVPLPDPAVPGRGWRGNVLLVAKDVTVDGVELLHLPGIEPRGAIVAGLRIGAARLRVVASHLALDPVNRARQARLISAHLEGLPAGPAVFLGDTNEWRAEGCLAPLIRHLPQTPVARSFPAWCPALPLDRIMMRGGCVRDFRVHRTALSRRASDHLPVQARLVLA